MKLVLSVLLAGSIVSVFAATLTVRVVEDHSGAPVALADIRLIQDGTRHVLEEPETDARGVFLIPELPAGTYRVEIAKPNFVSTTLRLVMKTEPQSITARLIHNAAFAGTVRDQKGNPVPAVHVFALPKNGASGPNPPYGSMREGVHASTDETGRYRLYGLPPGRYLIAASYGSSTTAVGQTGGGQPVANAGSGVVFYPSTAQPQTFNLMGGEDLRNIDFTLGQSALFSVSGHVDTPPKPGRVWLALAPSSQPAIAAAAIIAEENGSFRFDGIAPGQYELFAAGPSRARNGQGAFLEPNAVFARSQVVVAGQNVDGLALSLQSGRRGMVGVRGGGPGCAATAKVKLISLEDWAAVLGATVDVAVGQDVPLENLPPAHFDVQVASSGDACYQSSKAVLDMTAAASDRPVLVNVAPLGSIHGRLKARAQGDIELVLVPESFNEETRAGDVLRIELPDAVGGFQFGNVMPGSYRLTAKRTGGPARSSMAANAPGTVTVEVRGGAPTEIEVSLPQENNE